MIEELIGRVFATRNAAQIAHWNETSGYRHGVLGGFYAEVIDAIDALSEAWQGNFGALATVKVPAIKQPKDMVAYLREEADWIEANRAEIANESETVGALVDDLGAVYLATIYKLERFQ